MIRIFKHYVPKSLVILGIVESLILLGAIWGGMNLRYSFAGLNVPDLSNNIGEIVSFVLVVYIVLLATGFYELDACRDLKVTVIRLTTSLGLSFITLSVVLYIFPTIELWRSVIIYALFLAFVGLMISRYFYLNIVGLKGLKKRILVLGAGDRAERVRTCGKVDTNDVNFVCFLRVNKTETTIKTALDFNENHSLEDYISDLSVEEIVVAPDERRGVLPIEQLLNCKLKGCRIVEATTFIERQSGTVSLKNLNPSWMVFSDGFGRAGRLDMMLKRIFDVCASLILLAVSLPIILITSFMVKVTSQGPIFYRQERVGLNGNTFNVLKFRSMTIDAEKDSGPQWAAKNDVRVTTVGRVIRACRIDEIPQIFNVLAGTMSFVGPRPERPFFVEQFEQNIQLYRERHRVKPGITGWAQLNYPYGRRKRIQNASLSTTYTILKTILCSWIFLYLFKLYVSYYGRMV